MEKGKMWNSLLWTNIHSVSNMARILLASCIVVIALLSRTFLFYLPSFYLYTTTQSLEAPKAQRLPFTT